MLKIAGVVGKKTYDFQKSILNPNLFYMVFPLKSFFGSYYMEVVGNFGCMGNPYKKNSVFPYCSVW